MTRCHKEVYTPECNEDGLKISVKVNASLEGCDKMFLARKEMRYAKLRYSLIIGIMLLVSYVVFLLSGLATGLAHEFDQGIVNWQADEVILASDANQSLNASQLTQGDLTRVSAKEKAALGIFSGAIKKGQTQEDINLFATTDKAFVLPKVTSGKTFASKNEIIISQNLADAGYQIGDQVTIGKYEEPLTITGIFPTTYYLVSPVVYTSLETFTSLKYGNQSFGTTADEPVNAIVVKGAATLDNQSAGETLEALKTADFIEAIPGYAAQNLTLNGMIYFLFVIVAAVVGIFMYVITMQKAPIFGVMKAQGISNGFIAKSIVAQSFLVGVIGVALAILLALGTSLILPDAMPFLVVPQQWGLYSGILLVVAIVGGLFSIRTVTKVDPITAIGG